MDVHLKKKYIQSKAQALGTLAMTLFSIYPMWLFGYKI